jgi:hypothetical protein
VRALVLALLLVACGGGQDGSSSGLAELDDGLVDLAQGCSWRASRGVAVEPWHPEDCHNVFTGPNARLTDFELSDTCDAPELPSPFLFRPNSGRELWGYYDREQMPRFEVLRFERLDACP